MHRLRSDLAVCGSLDAKPAERWEGETTCWLDRGKRLLPGRISDVMSTAIWIGTILCDRKDKEYLDTVLLAGETTVHVGVRDQRGTPADLGRVCRGVTRRSSGHTRLARGTCIAVVSRSCSLSRSRLRASVHHQWHMYAWCPHPYTFLGSSRASMVPPCFTCLSLFFLVSAYVKK